MPLAGPLPDGPPSTLGSPRIPLIGEKASKNTGPRLQIFNAHGHERVPRSTPQPPTGPPPITALPPATRAADGLEVRLPGIATHEGNNLKSDLHSPTSLAGGSIDTAGERSPRHQEYDSATSSARRIRNASRQTDANTSHIRLAALSEAGEVLDGEGGRQDDASQVSGSTDDPSAVRIPNGIDFSARKAHRMAEVRSIAHEVARAVEVDGEVKKGEIERALAAVEETRRKRMERQHRQDEGMKQDDDRVRRRHAKREELMQKRKHMEERLKEEASKMAELTESAKRKGETKYMSEEAKRDAEERIRMEAEVVAQLEQQAADMVSKRENMQRELENASIKTAAEMELQAASALRAKRALVEARMKREEAEIKTLSEAAKREVEAKMAAEASVIAEMQKRAQQMSAQRAELEAEMSKRLRRESELAEEAQAILRKREALEAKVREEEEELQKLSEDAKRRVQEKMAAEAALIAEMERKVNELASERAVLESNMTSDEKSVRLPNGQDRPGNNCDDKLNAQVSCAGNNLESSASYARDVGEAYPGSQRDSQDAHGSQDCHHVTQETGLPIHEAGWEDDEVAACNGASGQEHPGAPPSYQGLHCDVIEAQHAAKTDVCSECKIRQHGMSSAHVAAASGHVLCLEAIRSSECPELLAGCDACGRNPLFYACANGHADAVKLLIGAHPNSCQATDMNEDTPLHAAALAGSALCCEYLLQNGRSEVEPQNATLMTPAHLAGNNEVLELLSQYGANLNAKDVDSRTPLFIACATDRLEKAEFLCELLECEGQDLREADKRGDTPMHAAAYNGSTPCLLLLLQYGVAPDVRNTKGLRPIDLASRRNHAACQKILMEYQLHHHVNNSYFDSVLFLATLEGHKKCKEVLTDSTGEAHPHAGAPVDDPLRRPDSLWSLRRGRSVRLEHHGDWIAYEDQNAQSVFWYNHVARKTQWEAPRGVVQSAANTVANSSMRLRREGDWIQYTLPEGKVFYYNDKSNDFRWDRPEGTEEASAESVESGVALESSPGGQVGDWAPYKDPSSGLLFWYNQASGESQWEPPVEMDKLDTSLQHTSGLSVAPEDVREVAPEEDVREVTSVDDLFTPR